MMQSLFLTQLALILLAGYASAGSERKCIDDFFEFAVGPNYKKMAQAVCELKDTKKYVVYRFDTVIKIIDLTAESMPECWARHGESMALLRKILTTSDDDYCSDAKLSLMEKFHRNYVSKIKKDVQNRKSNDLNAPALLKHFFIYYASYVASKCKSNIWSNLKRLNEASSNADKGYETDKAIFEKMLQEYDTNFSQESPSVNHKDVFLFWNVVDSISYGAKSKNLFAKYVKTSDELTSNDDYRVAIRVHSSKNWLAAQTYCRNHLQPIYSRSILPVIRLTDLGYLVEYLSSFTTIDKRWYSIAQFCETILPVRVVEDSALDAGRFVLLTKEEAAHLKDAEAKIVSHPANDVKLELNRMKEDRLVGSIFGDEEQKLKSELNARAEVVTRFLTKLAPRIKNYDKSNRRSIALSAGAVGEEDLAKTISRELNELKKPTFMERTKDSFYWALRKGLSALPYALLLVTSPLIIVAGCFGLIEEFLELSIDSSPGEGMSLLQMGAIAGAAGK